MIALIADRLRRSLARDRTSTAAAAAVPARTAFYALLGRLHFYAGLFVGPFILVAAVTGTLFVLTPQIEDLLYARQLRTESTGPAQPLARQIEAARAHIGPEPRLFAVRPAPGPGQTSRVMYSQPGLGDSESRAIFVDPVTLEIRGDLVVYGTSGILPLRTTLDYLHRNLLLGDLGRNYSELAASWLWLTAAGGVALWFGVHRRHAAARAAQPGSRQRSRRLHAWTGVWLLAGLVFFSATGLTWSQWAGGRIDQLRQALGWVTPPISLQLGGAAPPAAGHAHHDHAPHHMGQGDAAAMPVPPAVLQFDRVLAAAREAGIDSAYLEIRPPRQAGQAWMVREVDRSWPTQVDTIALDPASMAVTSRADFETFPLIAKLIRWGIDFHMGILFGLANQLLVAAFGIALNALVVLGYLTWWRRRPPPGAPVPTLWRAWRGLPMGWRAAVLAAAVALGWCLPLMGASLLAFLAVDVARGRLARG